MEYPRILEAGEQGLVVEMGCGIDPGVNDRVIGFYRHLANLHIPGWIEAIPSYRSILVLFVPSLLPKAVLRERLLMELERFESDSSVQVRQVDIPVVYGGLWGPDLSDVAAYAGLEEKEVIQIHSSGDYRVYMLGFTPGFPYLGGLDPRIAMPRLESPRTEIPAGSVGIAGTQTGVYPIASPGGWRLIGRTPLSLFSPENDPPARIQPGDRVRFIPMDEKDLADNSMDSRGKCRTSPLGGCKDDAIAHVLQPGFLTTIQDHGRWGYQHLGVPTSGAMDQRAFQLANLLLKNNPHTPVLEMTLAGTEIEFLQDTCAAVTGADLGAELNGRPFPLWSSAPVQSGSVLRFTQRRGGCRAYLAVSGGFQVVPLMGSASTYLRGQWGGLDGRALKAGDYLMGGQGTESKAGYSVPEELRSYIDDRGPIPVIPGPQEDAFTEDAVDCFYRSTYSVSSQSDRMGIRLDGPKLTHRQGADIISDGIPPGAIQIPGHGTPIVMTADRQTTGGYAKIGVVTRTGLDRLAQLIPGDRITFCRIEPDDAEGRFLREDSMMQKWVQSIQNKQSLKWILTLNNQRYSVTIQEKE